MTEVDLETRIVEVENDNRRLRSLLSQTGATKELRHRLSSTLAMLRTIIRKSANTPRDLEGYVAHVEDRMNAIARAQITIDAFGEIELGTLFANELLQCGAPEGQRSHLSGPVVFLQPRAGQVLTLAAHELAANALEHGALTTQTGRISVSWRTERSPAANELEIVWTESGSDPDLRGHHQGFGHEIVMRMLPYELDGTTVRNEDADGLRYVIRFALSERIGREEHEPEHAPSD